MTIGGISNSYSAMGGYYGMGTAQTAYGQQEGSRAGAVNPSGSVRPGNPLENGSTDNTTVKPGYKSSPAECKTCRERKYQDGSNETDVSFKAPGHIAPEASASTVMAHERMHVANAYQSASQKNGHVVSCSVSLHTSVCPECGRSYVSGGTTSTQISYPNESNPYQKERKAQDAIRYTGANIDYAA